MTGLLLTCALVIAIPAHAETLQEVKARAAALKAKGDAAGALAAYERAAELAPQAAEIQDEIGFLMAATNRAAEAKTRFERAIQLQSD